MPKTAYLFIIILILSSIKAATQTVGLEMDRGVDKIEIPFEYKNSFIIVDIIFNKILPLKFIFDTGAEYTIINKREVTDLFGINYEKEFKLLGSDMSTELTAYLTRGVQLDFDELHGSHQDVLVLAEDYFNIEEFTGVEIHGILGANFFKRYVVTIDFSRNMLIFIKPENFSKPPKRFKEVPSRFIRNKPYILTKTEITKDSILPLSLLVDSGASLGLLVHSNSHPGIRLPQNKIEGQLALGLGGFLTGYLGRVHQLSLNENLYFQNILTHFQSLTEQQDTTHLNGRNGVIGNLILHRFTIIIDYPRERIFLKPRKKYNRGFKFDKSGMNIIASGSKLNSYTVHHVIKGSPADEAGVQVGDEIVKVNRLHSSFFGMTHLTRVLQKKTGKKIRLVVRRNGKRLRFQFLLRELI